jgi:hypothetical protein
LVKVVTEIEADVSRMRLEFILLIEMLKSLFPPQASRVFVLPFPSSSNSEEYRAVQIPLPDTLRVNASELEDARVLVPGFTHTLSFPSPYSRASTLSVFLLTFTFAPRRCC